MKPRTGFFVVVIGLSVAAAVFAQQQQSLKIDVDLVMVNATVTDSENRLVTDLKPENFQVFEDKVEQSIRYFSTEVAPLSLGIVFDVSHSMEKKIDFAREAAATFLEAGTPDDEYFLVEFNNRAKITEDFTTDISRLRDQLAFGRDEYWRAASILLQRRRQIRCRCGGRIAGGRGDRNGGDF